MTKSFLDRPLMRPAVSSDASEDENADCIPLTSILGVLALALAWTCFGTALLANSGCAGRFAFPLGMLVGGAGVGEGTRRGAGTSQLFSISSRSFCWSFFERFDFFPLLMYFSSASGSLKALISLKSSSMTSESVSTRGGRGYGQSSESVSNGTSGRGLGGFLDVDGVGMGSTRGWVYIVGVDSESGETTEVVLVELKDVWKCTSEGMVSTCVVCCSMRAAVNRSLTWLMLEPKPRNVGRGVTSPRIRGPVLPHSLSPICVVGTESCGIDAVKDPGSEAPSSLASLSPSYRADEARDSGRPKRVDMTS